MTDIRIIDRGKGHEVRVRVDRIETYHPVNQEELERLVSDGNAALRVMQRLSSREWR